jgi:DNA-directed RNA polymerase subunit E"
MVKEFACRNCKTLTTGKVCPSCNSTDLSPEWSGLVVLMDGDRSQIAHTLQISKPGRYALNVR